MSNPVPTFTLKALLKNFTIFQWLQLVCFNQDHKQSNWFYQINQSKPKQVLTQGSQLNSKICIKPIPKIQPTETCYRNLENKTIYNKRKLLG